MLLIVLVVQRRVWELFVFELEFGLALLEQAVLVVTAASVWGQPPAAGVRQYK